MSTTDPNAVYLDSGATKHMSSELSILHDVREIPPGSWPINGIRGTVLYVLGICTIKFTKDFEKNTNLGE